LPPHGVGSKVGQGLLCCAGVTLVFNQSNSPIGIGGKYYIGGTVPVEIGGGVLSGGGFSDFLGSLSVGYAANIAPNIALEPTIGILVSDGSVLEFGLTFAMFL